MTKLSHGFQWDNDPGPCVWNVHAGGRSPCLWLKTDRGRSSQKQNDPKDQ